MEQQQRGNSGTLDYISRPAVIVSCHERRCIAVTERGEARGEKEAGGGGIFIFWGLVS